MRKTKFFYTKAFQGATGVVVVIMLFSVWGAGIISGSSPESDVRVDQKAGNASITLTVPQSQSAPGYEVRIASKPLEIATYKAGKEVLSTISSDGAEGPIVFEIDGNRYKAAALKNYTWDGNTLQLVLSTSSPKHELLVSITPEADRYQFNCTVNGPGNIQKVGLVVNLSSAGHWYGHGEVENERAPWPLETGDVDDPMFGPASYFMIDPFWFTSSSVGLNVDTMQVMEVSINHEDDGLGHFLVKDTNKLNALFFVENTPKDVYDDYIGIVGKPEKSDASYEQYELPLWNTWAQFYAPVTQEDVLNTLRI